MFFGSLDHTRENAPVFRAFYMEIEIEIWMLRDERHVSAFRDVGWFPNQSPLLAAPLRR
jgi:hypothetical protein